MIKGKKPLAPGAPLLGLREALYQLAGTPQFTLAVATVLRELEIGERVDSFEAHFQGAQARGLRGDAPPLESVEVTQQWCPVRLLALHHALEQLGYADGLASRQLAMSAGSARRS